MDLQVCSVTQSGNANRGNETMETQPAETQVLRGPSQHLRFRGLRFHGFVSAVRVSAVSFPRFAFPRQNKTNQNKLVQFGSRPRPQQSKQQLCHHHASHKRVETFDWHYMPAALRVLQNDGIRY